MGAKAGISTRATSALPAACIVLLVQGCSPALDWRDVRPEGSGAHLLFPCKPTSRERQVQLAGTTVAMSLHACSADGQTFGLAHADVGDPARATAALLELAASAAANLKTAASAASAPSPFRVPGSTPHAASGHVRLRGSLPDGNPAAMQLVVFARGTRVFQATIVGADVSEQAASSFFASLEATP